MTKLKPELEKEIYEIYKGGKTIGEIADSYSITRQTVEKIIEKQSKGKNLCMHGNYHCNECEVILLKKVTEGYAGWLVESVRIQLGYDAKDSSHDDEVVRQLESGTKMSKSKFNQSKGGIKK